MKAARAPPRSNPPSAPRARTEWEGEPRRRIPVLHPAAASRSCTPELHPAAAPGARGLPPVAHPSVTAAPGWGGGDTWAPQALSRAFGGVGKVCGWARKGG